MENKKIIALGFGTANQGEQSQLIGALNAIAKLTKTEVDIDKQVLLPKNVDSLFEMKDNISESIKVKRCSIFRKLMMMNKKEKLYNAINESVSKIL